VGADGLLFPTHFTFFITERFRSDLPSGKSLSPKYSSSLVGGTGGLSLVGKGGGTTC